MPCTVCDPAEGTTTFTLPLVVAPLVASVAWPCGRPSRLMVTVPVGGELPGLDEVTVPVTVMVAPPMGVVVEGATTNEVGLG